MKAKSARGKKTRDRILAAARDLIEQNGVASTSVDDVLAASGTGKSQFYHYFGSKDLLVRDLVAIIRDDLPVNHASILNAAQSLADITAWLESIGSAALKGRYARGSALGTLAAELGGTTSDSRTLLEEAYEAWREALASALARAMPAEAHISKEARSDQAQAIIASLEGAMLLARLKGGSETPILIAVRQLKSSLKPAPSQVPGRMVGAVSAKPVKSIQPTKRPFTGFCP